MTICVRSDCICPSALHGWCCFIICWLNSLLWRDIWRHRRYHPGILSITLAFLFKIFFTDSLKLMTFFYSTFPLHFGALHSRRALLSLHQLIYCTDVSILYFITIQFIISSFYFLFVCLVFYNKSSDSQHHENIYLFNSIIINCFHI